jgi:hypothetical protein
MSDHEVPDGVPIVHDVDRKHLNRLQVEEYRDHRRRVLSWFRANGRCPGGAKGYSEAVVESTAYRLSKMYRWVWEREGYTATITHDHADTFVEELKTRDWSDENKNQYVKALKRYFAWRTREGGVDEWEPEQTYAPGQQTITPATTSPSRSDSWCGTLPWSTAPYPPTTTSARRSATAGRSTSPSGTRSQSGT